MDATNRDCSGGSRPMGRGGDLCVNGFLTGSWAPQIPVFLTRLGISEFTLGLLILVFGAGAVSAMAWAGHLIAKHGSQRVVRTLCRRPELSACSWLRSLPTCRWRRSACISSAE